MIPDGEIEIPEVESVLTDMAANDPVEHKFDHIVGNQLLCSLHGHCNAIFVKPTEVLEEIDGKLVLVDRAAK